MLGVKLLLFMLYASALRFIIKDMKKENANQTKNDQF